MDYDLDSGVLAMDVKSKIEKLFEDHSILNVLKNVKANTPSTEENLNVPNIAKQKWAPVGDIVYYGVGCDFGTLFMRMFLFEEHSCHVRSIALRRSLSPTINTDCIVSRLLSAALWLASARVTSG